MQPGHEIEVLVYGPGKAEVSAAPALAAAAVLPPA
jgi:hypothetical protein